MNAGRPSTDDGLGAGRGCLIGALMSVVIWLTLAGLIYLFRH